MKNVSDIKKTRIKRYIMYLMGLIILALGITMNTKTGLGVSPIISIAYCVSQIWSLNLGIMTFIFYAVFVILQKILMGKEFDKKQVMQIGVSFITSFFIQVFNIILPRSGNILESFITLIGAILLTGIGATITVCMDMVPNPADGLANVIGIKLHKGMGTGKNIFDLSCLVLSLMIGLIFKRSIIGIGIGTICTMIFTGRVVAVSKKYIDRLYGKIIL
jgi:uncharacterized membrane protein YczE